MIRLVLALRGSSQTLPKLHQPEHGLVRRHPAASVQGVPVHTTVFSCHQGRVKVRGGLHPCSVLHALVQVAWHAVSVVAERGPARLATWQADEMKLGGCPCMQAVEASPDEPAVFWSVSEDGMLRQFDTRCGSVAASSCIALCRWLSAVGL